MQLSEGRSQPKWVAQLPAFATQIAKLHRPVGLQEQKLPSDVGIRYLYHPGQLVGSVFRSTFHILSLRFIQ